MLFPNADVVVNPALLLLLGLMAGTLGGFFGVGAAFLITGGLLVFGVPPLFAVGTGLTMVMGTSIINTLKHRKLGNVDFRLSLLTVAGTVPGLLLAERLNSRLEAAGMAGPVIGDIYVVLLAGMGLFILYDCVKASRGDVGQRGEITTAGLARWVQSLRIPPHWIGLPKVGRVSLYVRLPASGIEVMPVMVLVSIGFGVGFSAGILGNGGAFIMLPAMIFVLGVPTAVAVGTGLLQIIITSSVGTLVYALSNHVDLLMVVVMLATSAIGAQLGASATKAVAAARIRFLFAITLMGSSVAIGLRQIGESAAGAEFLSTAATVVLLGVAGAMCVVIAAMMVAARRRPPASS
jgi:hypothetical protein